MVAEAADELEEAPAEGLEAGVTFLPSDSTNFGSTAFIALAALGADAGAAGAGAVAAGVFLGVFLATSVLTTATAATAAFATTSSKKARIDFSIASASAIIVAVLSCAKYTQ